MNYNDMVPGAFFGVGLFFSTLWLIAQCLPEPIHTPWPAFWRGACLAYGVGLCLIAFGAVIMFAARRGWPR